MINVDGIDALHFTDAGKGMTIKNKSSVRKIPLHPAIRAEIVALAKSVATSKGADAFLFDYPHWRSSGSRAGKFQKRINAWLRNKLKITDESVSNHGWRHRFIEKSRDAGVPIYVAHGITGHKLSPGEHGSYGKIGLKTLAKWIAEVDPLQS